MSQDRTGQLWELYSYESDGDGWVCLIVGPPLKKRGHNGFTLHPMACLQVPSDIDDPKDYIPVSSDGRTVLEESASEPWEQNGYMKRIGQ